MKKTIKNKFQKGLDIFTVLTVFVSTYCIGNLLEFDKITFNQFYKYALILIVSITLMWYALSKLNIAITKKLFPR